MLRPSASLTELADISYFCCTDIQAYQSLLESSRDCLALAARPQLIGYAFQMKGDSPRGNTQDLSNITDLLPLR